MVRECSFSPLCTSHWVYCSLNVRMLEIIWPVKCRSIGNPLEGQYPGTLSISLSTLPASSQCHPCLYCQNILFQFSASRLPNSCHRQLDSVDVAKASLPAHYPTPCHAPSFPGPSRHKLIGLNPVINRLEKQLSMFVSLPKAGLFGHSSPLSFPALHFSQHTTALCPFLPSFLAPWARARLTSLDTNSGSSG